MGATCPATLVPKFVIALLEGMPPTAWRTHGTRVGRLFAGEICRVNEGFKQLPNGPSEWSESV
jgi:hypothetical protein